MNSQKKRRLKISGIVLLCVAIAAACYLLFTLINKPSSGSAAATATPTATAKPTPTPSPLSTNDMSDVKITTNSFEAYKLDDLDFGFLIANVHVKSTKTGSIALSYFTTNDGIQLSNVQSYKDALKEHSYSLDSLNLASTLSANGSEADVKIFIPFKDKSETNITVDCDFNADNNLTFAIGSADTTAENLKIASTATPTDTKNFSVTVESAGEIDPSSVLTKDDASYFLPSTARVFAIHVNVTAATGKPVNITSASLVTTSYGTVGAETSDIHTAKMNSILNQKITDSGDGYIFILMLDPGYEIQSVEGQLDLKMTDQSQNTSVNVTLK